MASLFSPADNAAIIQRLQALSPEHKAQWGKMNISQMLTHCQVPLRVAFGEVKLKRTLIGFLFGRMALKRFAGAAIFDKNLPTEKSFVITSNPEFEAERGKLIALVKRFLDQGPSAITKEPHPFFGKMTTEQWDTVQWKHLDHHLRQFGG